VEKYNLHVVIEMDRCRFWSVSTQGFSCFDLMLIVRQICWMHIGYASQASSCESDQAQMSVVSKDCTEQRTVKEHVGESGDNEQLAKQKGWKDI
jgi:hypothetical protein